MSLDPVQLLRRYHAALEPFDAEKVAAMFAPDAFYVSRGVNGRLDGRDEIIAAFAAYFREHPDQRALDEEIVALGPREARARWQLSATSASSGLTVRRHGTEIVSFDACGRILRVVVEDL